MSTTASQILATARAELGVTESPPDSNLVKYSYWYPMPGEPWCAMFVSWVFDRHDSLGILCPKYAYTPDGADWYRDRNAWYSKPKVGDVVFYTWPDMGRISHTGIVENVYSDGSIDAIEGNTDSSGGRTGGKVMRQHRTTYITGYGRPDYDTDGGGAMYYCQVTQNTGQEVTGSGEDIRMQDDVDDALGWHDESQNYPSISPNRSVVGTGHATCQVDGPAEVRLRLVATDGTSTLRWPARETTDGGFVAISGPVKMSAGHRLRLYVVGKDNHTVTVRNATLALTATDL